MKNDLFYCDANKCNDLAASSPVNERGDTLISFLPTLLHTMAAAARPPSLSHPVTELIKMTLSEPEAHLSAVMSGFFFPVIAPSPS